MIADERKDIVINMRDDNSKVDDFQILNLKLSKYLKKGSASGAKSEVVE
jgi:hypothetical protein